MDSQPDEFSHPVKADRIRAMFAEIAPRYDFLNHALSLNTDRRWRRLVVKQVAAHLMRPGARALDLCCGTADLALQLGRLAPTVGMDFCHPMLTLGLEKVRKAAARVELVEADALAVPGAAESFDVVTIAFGLRNLESVEGGLREMYRLLKHGGRSVVLEFSRPRMPIFRSIFEFYFNRILPCIGNRVSGSQFAYQYLPDSVKQFPDQKGLAAMMRSVGFSGVSYYNLSGGIATMHIGDKAGTEV